MQHILSINQYVAIALGLDKQLNAIDLLLFDYVYHTMNDANSVKRVIGQEEYTMITHSMIKEELPLLGLNHRDTFRKRMNKLCEAGLIERYNCKLIYCENLYKDGRLFSAITSGTLPTKIGTLPTKIGTLPTKIGALLENIDILQKNTDIFSAFIGKNRKFSDIVYYNKDNNIYNNIYNKNSSNDKNNNKGEYEGDGVFASPELKLFEENEISVEFPKDEIVFDEFRKVYRGTKRGLKTEFLNFKKHSDWKIVLPNLKVVYEHQCALKDAAQAKGCFVPSEKNLKTYINQRCWEDELQFEPPRRKEEQSVEERMREIEQGYQKLQQYKKEKDARNGRD